MTSRIIDLEHEMAMQLATKGMRAVEDHETIESGDYLVRRGVPVPDGVFGPQDVPVAAGEICRGASAMMGDKPEAYAVLRRMGRGLE